VCSSDLPKTPKPLEMDIEYILKSLVKKSIIAIFVFVLEIVREFLFLHFKGMPSL